MYHPDTKSRLVTWSALVVGLFSLVIVILSHFLKNGIYQSDWLIVFFEMLLLAVAYWLWREAERKDQIYIVTCANKYIANWRRGLALLFFIVGLQGIIIAANIHTPFSNLIDSYKDDKPEDIQTILLAFMGMIIAVASAYYLVVLQGAWNQTRDLMKKLEARENDLRKLHNQLNILSGELNDESSVMSHLQNCT